MYESRTGRGGGGLQSARGVWSISRAEQSALPPPPLLLLLTALTTTIGRRGCGAGRSQRDADQHITSSIAYRRQCRLALMSAAYDVKDRRH